jgi:hypothetical protein
MSTALLHIPEDIGEKYKAASGQVCPFCQASPLLESSPSTTGLKVTIPKRCLRCGAEWKDVFALVESIVIERGRPMEPRKEKKPLPLVAVAREYQPPPPSSPDLVPLRSPRT